MKRLLIFALALVLAFPLGGCAPEEAPPAPPAHQDATALSNVDYGPHRPVGVYAVEEQMRDKDYWAQETPQVDLTATFEKAQEDFFDYFYNRWGFGVGLSRTDEGGTFPQAELLHSVCSMLYYYDAREETTFTKAELIAGAKRFFGQTIDSFTGCGNCHYDSETETLKWDNGCMVFPGHIMVLRQLRVGKDGMCVGIFDRSHENYYTGDMSNVNSDDLRETFLAGVYDELSTVDTIVVTFRECKDETYGTYLQILSISNYTGLGSNTK